MTDDQRLVIILAGTDGLFLPHRQPLSRDAMSGIAERQGRYREHGLPFLSRAAPSVRREQSRLLGKLEDEGLLTIRGRTQSLSVRLTDAGMDRARRLACCWRPAQVWPVLELVALLTDQGQVNAGCVLDADLLTDDLSRPTDAEILELERKAQPLLTDGLLRSWPDTLGAIGYSVTPAGRAALAAGKPEHSPTPPDWPALNTVYDDALERAIQDRQTWQPSARGLVVIPLSAGMWRRPTDK